MPMVVVQDCFSAAVRLVQSMPKEGPFEPSNELKLKLYALYKQVTVGQCCSSKPAFWDVVNRAKWNAWNDLGDMTDDDAMEEYVLTLRELVETMPLDDSSEAFIRADAASDESLKESVKKDFELAIGYSTLKKNKSVTNGRLVGHTNGTVKNSEHPNIPNGHGHSQVIKAPSGDIHTNGHSSPVPIQMVEETPKDYKKPGSLENDDEVYSDVPEAYRTPPEDLIASTDSFVNYTELSADSTNEIICSSNDSSLSEFNGVSPLVSEDETVKANGSGRHLQGGMEDYQFLTHETTAFNEPLLTGFQQSRDILLLHKEEHSSNDQSEPVVESMMSYQNLANQPIIDSRHDDVKVAASALTGSSNNDADDDDTTSKKVSPERGIDRSTNSCKEIIRGRRRSGRTAKIIREEGRGAGSSQNRANPLSTAAAVGGGKSAISGGLFSIPRSLKLPPHSVVFEGFTPPTSSLSPFDGGFGLSNCSDAAEATTMYEIWMAKAWDELNRLRQQQMSTSSEGASLIKSIKKDAHAATTNKHGIPVAKSVHKTTTTVGNHHGGGHSSDGDAVDGPGGTSGNSDPASRGGVSGQTNQGNGASGGFSGFGSQGTNNHPVTPRRDSIGRNSRNSSGGSSPSVEMLEFDPHISDVLIRMHRELRGISRQLELMESILFAQQQMLRNTMAAVAERTSFRLFVFPQLPWRTIFFILAWPFAAHYLARFFRYLILKRFLKRRLL